MNFTKWSCAITFYRWLICVCIIRYIDRISCRCLWIHIVLFMILCLFIECLQIGDCFVLSVFKYWPLPILYCKYIHERNIHTDLLLLLFFIFYVHYIVEVGCKISQKTVSWFRFFVLVNVIWFTTIHSC